MVCSWKRLKWAWAGDTTGEDGETADDSACPRVLPAPADVIPGHGICSQLRVRTPLTAQLRGTWYLTTPVPGNEMGTVLSLLCSKNVWNGTQQKKTQQAFWGFWQEAGVFPFPAGWMAILMLPSSLSPTFSDQHGRMRYWKLPLHAFSAFQYHYCWSQFYHCLVVLQFTGSTGNVFYSSIKKNFPKMLSWAAAFPQPAQKIRLKPTALAAGPCQVWSQRLTGGYLKQEAQQVTIVFIFTVLTKNTICRAFNLPSLVFSMFFFSPSPSQWQRFLFINICDK